MSIVKLRLELDLPALHDNALHGEVNNFLFFYNTSLVLEKELCPYPTQNIILFIHPCRLRFRNPIKPDISDIN